MKRGCRGRMPESCKREIRGGFDAMTPQQPEEWELRRKTAEGSPQGAAAGRRQVKVGRLQPDYAPAEWGGYNRELRLPGNQPTG